MVLDLKLLLKDDTVRKRSIESTTLAGCYGAEGDAPKRAMTLSMSAQFLAAAKEGDRLIAEAHCSGRGKSIYFARCQIRNQEGHLIGSDATEWDGTQPIR